MGSHGWRNLHTEGRPGVPSPSGLPQPEEPSSGPVTRWGKQSLSKHCFFAVVPDTERILKDLQMFSGHSLAEGLRKNLFWQNPHHEHGVRGCGTHDAGARVLVTVVCGMWHSLGHVCDKPCSQVTRDAVRL